MWAERLAPSTLKSRSTPKAAARSRFDRKSQELRPLPVRCLQLSASILLNDRVPASKDGRLSCAGPESLSAACQGTSGNRASNETPYPESSRDAFKSRNAEGGIEVWSRPDESQRHGAHSNRASW
jgi:hypothetical protein